MAAKKTEVVTEELTEEVKAAEPIDEVKAEEPIEGDSITIKAAEPPKEVKEQTVRIFIPALEDSGSEGLVVDQYEHVTVANMIKEKIDYVRRGEYVDVSIPTFLALKEKYPNL